MSRKIWLRDKLSEQLVVDFRRRLRVLEPVEVLAEELLDQVNLDLQELGDNGDGDARLRLKFRLLDAVAESHDVAGQLRELGGRLFHRGDAEKQRKISAHGQSGGDLPDK